MGTALNMYWQSNKAGKPKKDHFNGFTEVEQFHLPHFLHTGHVRNII